MDEHAFVDRLIKLFPFRDGLGIGDDTSVIPSGDGYQLVTTDMMIENVHFRLQDVSMDTLAHKALAVNVSDIAAMGGSPRHAYLNLAFPDRLQPADLDAFLQGMAKSCDRWETGLAGGDFSRSEQLFIAITVTGFTTAPVYRRGARPGDLIGISGPTGKSALGLRCLLDGHDCPEMIEAHQRSKPRVTEGGVLSRFVNSMIDVSDGLLIDLERIARVSGVGARIEYEKLPVSPFFSQRCRSYGYDEQQLVLSGGEDYELLFTLSRKQERGLEATGLEYWIIGEILDRPRRVTVTRGGKEIRSQTSGYDHFRT